MTKTLKSLRPLRSLRLFQPFAFLLLIAALTAFSSFAQSTVPVAPPTTPQGFLAALIDSSQIPNNLTTFGVNLNGEGQNLAGESAYYHLVTGTTYAGIKSNLSGSTSSDTAELKQVVFAKHGLMVLINGNAGLATGANGGVGGAYMAGAAGLYNLSRLKPFRAHPGIWVGAEWENDSRNVQQFATAFKAAPNAALLKDFARQSTWGFFAGYAW